MSKKEKMIFGSLKEETADPRNYNISQFIPGEDEIDDVEFMLKFPKTQIIIDQGSIGACVGHSFAMAKSILEYNHTNKWIDFDPFMIYGTRFPGEYTGVGMYPVQGAKVLHKEGAFFRRDFGLRKEMPLLKDEVDTWKSKHNPEVNKAATFKITGYSYVYNETGIKKAIKNGMPVSVAYPIYSSFYKTGDDGVVPIPKSNEKIEGYHQMLIVGWTHDKWVVVNSWGTDSGLKGMYLIPFKNKFDSAIAVSDTITPTTYKAKEISFVVGETKYLVDGQEKEFDVIPYIKNNRTYVPVRFITESLGASVEWNEQKQEVTVRSEEAVIVMTIGSKNITVNGKRFVLDVVPEIVDNRTMLPARFISEYLNCEVLWEEATNKVIIKAL